MKPEKLIGKRVDITDKKSQWFGHWGFITEWDGETFHVTGGSISSSMSEITPIFDRDQFVVKRGRDK